MKTLSIMLVVAGLFVSPAAFAKRKVAKVGMSNSAERPYCALMDGKSVAGSVKGAAAGKKGASANGAL